MSGEAISKRIKWIFVLCMFAGALGIAEMIFNSIHYHYFAGFPLFPLLVIAEGIVFFFAFRENNIEKALVQLTVVRVFSIVLCGYSIYSLIMTLVRGLQNGMSVFNAWFSFVYILSGLFASLGILVASITLNKSKTDTFRIATNWILGAAGLLLFGITVSALIVADVLIPVIIGLVLFVLLFGFVPKALGNRIVRGAIIGSIIAGDVGAIIGAAAAASKQDQK